MTSEQNLKRSLKMLEEIKRSILNVNLKKTPEEGSGLRNSLKMELHVKIVNGLKL